jgi:hypothetical protein
MKAGYVLFMAAALFSAFSGSVFAGADDRSAKEKEISAQIANMKNPFQEVSSLSEAQDRAGFIMKQLKYIPDYYDPNPVYMIHNEGIMIQVVYVEPMDQKRITYRASKKISSAEMNGDFSEYQEERKLKIGDMDLLVKGSDGVIYTAEWGQDGINYSLLIDDGMEEIEIRELFTGALNEESAGELQED